MPLIKLQIAKHVSDEEKEDILSISAKMISEIMGKPEAYVMAILDSNVSAYMAGESDPVAFVDIRGIGGFSADVNNKISEQLCALLKDKLDIDPSRIYLNFTDISASNWGWNGGTFG